jgi:site-specific DNA-methyltransferase (adenine-specific)
MKQKHRFNIFPEMNSDDYQRLKDDIEQNGFDDKQPIYIYEDQILDGWNRQKACLELDLQPYYKVFNGTPGDAINFVMRTNKRRNLTKDQWRIIAAESEELIEIIKKEIEEQKRNKLIGNKNASKNDVSINCHIDLFDSLNTKPKRTMDMAAKIFNTNRTDLTETINLKKNKPELYEQVKNGNKSFAEIKKEELQIKAKQEKLQSIDKAKQLPKIENIILGDSTIETLNCPSNIKCVLTDPPYGMSFISNRRQVSAKDEGIYNDDSLEKALEITKKVYINLYDKMQDDSVLFSFIGWKQERYFMEMIEDCGFTIKNSIIWVKNNHGSGDLTGSFSPKHERIIFAVKGNPKLNFRPEDVLEGKEIITQHPTSKPIDLLKVFIEATTNEGDLIVDPFAGHGSTGIAAKKLKRNFWLCEMDEYNHSQIKININKYE